MKAKHLILATLLLWAALPARALVYGIFEYEISGTRAVIKGLTSEPLRVFDAHFSSVVGAVRVFNAARPPSGGDGTSLPRGRASE